MNEQQDSLLSEWLDVARKDWNRIHRMLEYDDAVASALFLQQSLEKYLKAFLIQHGWKLRKIHELDALLDNAVKYNPELEYYRDLCERVSGYYFTDLLKKPQINADEHRFEVFSSESNKSPQRTRIGRIFRDAKSVCIRVIRAIRVLSHIKLANNNGFFIPIFELSFLSDSVKRISAFTSVHLQITSINMDSNAQKAG
ncbi:MAG: HEPN domain-containing protein [Candidatus Methanoperedens sp.]|nr:HEPN domain-containing protein [Candidatus Methanoperedens sp.]